MNENRLTEQLQEIGMTKYQSLTYIAAVGLGTARPAELADEADVPQSRIYDVIDDLDEMGLVEVHERTGGKEVNAPPPEVILQEFKQRHFDSFTNTIQSVSTELSELYTHERNTRGYVTMVQSEDAALRHIRGAINDADWWLSLSLSPDLYATVADDLAAAVERGVTVRFICHGTTPTAEYEPEFPRSMWVRYREMSDVFAIADRGYGIFQGTYPATDEQPYLITQEGFMVHLLQNYSDQIWPTSAVLQEKEMYPRWYLEPRHVITTFRDDLHEKQYTARLIGHRKGERYRDEWTGAIVDYDLSGPVDDDFLSALPVTATLTVDIGTETLSVGGWKSTAEEIAAHAIEISR